MAGHRDEIIFPYIISFDLVYIQNRPDNAQWLFISRKFNGALCFYPVHRAIVPMYFYFIKMLTCFHCVAVRRPYDLVHILIRNMAADLGERWLGISRIAEN